MRRVIDFYTDCRQTQPLKAQEVAPWYKQRTEILRELKDCREVQQGKLVHSFLVKTGRDSDPFLASSLINMYATCGDMLQARVVFDGLAKQDVVTWTALVAGYVNNGLRQTGLECFSRMQHEGCVPNARTYISVLKACSVTDKLDKQDVKMKTLERVMAVHAQAAREGLESDVFLESILVDLYCKSGCMKYARACFKRLPERDAISWTPLILGYVENGEPELALQCFADLIQSHGAGKLHVLASCSAPAFAGALKACSNLGSVDKLKSLEKGMFIHSLANKVFGSHLSTRNSELTVPNSLLDMYAKCGSLVDSQTVFNRIKEPSVVSWTALMSGYVTNGEPELALKILAQCSCQPNSRTYVVALRAASFLAEKERLDEEKLVKPVALGRGMAIHSRAVNLGFERESYVSATLVSMYSNCSSMEDAHRVFLAIPEPGLVSWNALILGFADNGRPELSLELLDTLKREGCHRPNGRTLAAALKACGLLTTLGAGRDVHSVMCRGGEGEIQHDVVLETNLVEFYCRCGSVVHAQVLFDGGSGCRDLVTWNSLMGGYSRKGDVSRVLNMFHGMEEEGLSGDAVTFVIVLSSCGHAGLVERGRKFFREMSVRYGAAPGVGHCNCFLDLLLRARYDEAVRLVNELPPFKANEVTWRTCFQNKIYF